MVRWSAVGLLAVFFLFGNYSFYNIKQAIVYYGSKMSPSFHLLGEAVFISLLIYLIFTDEINRFIIKTRKKVKLREENKK